MSDPRSSSDATQVHRRNGGGSNGHRVAPDLDPVKSRPSSKGRLALALFVGGCSALIFFGGIAGVLFYESKEVRGSLAKLPHGAKAETPLTDVSKWEPGQEAAKPLTDDAPSDIGWWARHFDLPDSDAVSSYLKGQGINVAKIVPLHYEDTKDATTITYQVYAEVPEQLMRLQQVTWQPPEPDLAPFQKVLVLNEGLPPGTMWDAQHPTVAAEAGKKLNFAWQLKWDKNYNSVTTDRLPNDEGVFTQEQIAQFQTTTSTVLSQLNDQVQQIDQRVQADTQEKLAQVPANPPKPSLMSTKWNHGDGSGEPTKSAERMGGSTAAGAAGGAAFGAVAGDAGLGAGIGAGVGLLGGFLYDTVSKNNDRHAYERRAAAENDERLSEWRAQIKALDKQRAQIKQEAVTEKQQSLQDLASQISQNQGKLPVSTNTSDAFNNQPQPVTGNTSQPTSDQPSGPIK